MKKQLFGTDGIRGEANQYPITAELAMRFGMAAGIHFRSRKEHHRDCVVIAKDTRISGYMLEPALTAGFISVGCDVVLVGPMPTPAVPMLMKSLRADLGVMISASHNPFQDNGLKLFASNGYKLADQDELEIEKLILHTDLNQFLTSANTLGRARRLDDAQGRYIEYAKSRFPRHKSLDGLRIVVDCANGSGYRVAPNILWELGAEVITINCEPTGFNINEECGAINPRQLSLKVQETRADLGIALDGDADRLVLCDEKGKVIAGDHLIGAIAHHMYKTNTLKGSAIVATLMSNGGLEKFINGLGLEMAQTAVGDKYVSAKMRQLGSNLGGEQSGHIIVGSASSTGDGIIAALTVLDYLITNNLKASMLHKIFKLQPQKTISISYKGKNPLENSQVQSSITKLQEQNPNSRILVRKSGTEAKIRIMVEGEQSSCIEDIIEQVKMVISAGVN
jgi:phosphoglucosamine mutase